MQQDIKNSMEWINFALTQKDKTMAQVSADPKLDQAMKNAISHLPRFQEEGNATAVIIYVGAEPSRFREDELALCMYLWNSEKQQGDWWIGSLSNNFIQTGNNAGKSYMQNTIEILQKIGYDAYKVGNFSGLPQMVGMEIPIWIKRVDKNGKTYFNIGSIGSSFDVPASVSLAAINLNVGAAAPAFGQQQQAQQPQGFGQPPQQPQQPQQSAFAQPQQSAFAQPQQPAFGQPQQAQSFGQPQQAQAWQPGYGQPAANSPYSGNQRGLI
jgi:hypothetical protein